MSTETWTHRCTASTEPKVSCGRELPECTAAGGELTRLGFRGGDGGLRALRRLCRGSVLRSIPDRKALPEDSAGGRRLSAAGRHQAEEDPGPLRLRRGSHLHHPSGGGGEKQAPGRVCALTFKGKEEHKALWEKKENGRVELLTSMPPRPLPLFNVDGRCLDPPPPPLNPETLSPVYFWKNKQINKMELDDVECLIDSR